MATAQQTASSAAAVVPLAGRDSATAAALNTSLALSAGALAGAISRTITSPLERLKVMKQVQATNTKYDGLGSALIRMYKEEGLRGYWKGNGTNVVRIAPFSAIQFMSFDVYKGLLFGDQPNPGFLPTLSAGALTGMTASTICYPLDLVRSVLSVQTTQKNYNGIGDAMRSIVRKDGFFGLYRGIGATLVGIAPYIALNMTTYDLMKRELGPRFGKDSTTLMNLTLGACAGFIAVTFTYPTDLIRRRMQLQGMQGDYELPPYRNTLHCVTETVRLEGVRGLYKGLVPCFLKVVPSMAIAFTTYATLKDWWGFDPTKLSKPPSSG